MFSNVKTKANSKTIHFYCLLDEPRFSDICMIIELKGHTRKPGLGTLQKPENRDPSGTLQKLENQDPSGNLQKPENRDPSRPYINPTCCKNVLHKQHGQLGFHFLMLFFIFLIHSKELDLLYFMVSKLKFLETRKM